MKNPNEQNITKEFEINKTEKSKKWKFERKEIKRKTSKKSRQKVEEK